MLESLAENDLTTLPRGSHVGWAVTDSKEYLRLAQALVVDGAAEGEKVLAFGPDDGGALDNLRPFVAMAADPTVAVLDNGPVEPERIFGTFRQQRALAEQQGYAGIRVVADMDWLLGTGMTSNEIVAFELLLDRLTRELDATIVCAYRASSFEENIITGTLAVHSTVAGNSEPPFRLFASGPTTWRLTGEIDFSVESAFSAATSAATGAGPCLIDLSGVEFIDVSGLRALAKACAGKNGSVQFKGLSSHFRRLWQVGGFDRIATLSEVVSPAEDNSA